MDGIHHRNQVRENIMFNGSSGDGNCIANGNSFETGTPDLILRPVPTWKFGISVQSMMGDWR